MTDEVKLCKDCVHFRWRPFGYHICVGQNEDVVSLISGKRFTKKNEWECATQRNYPDCGLGAKMFQQDHSPDFFQKYLT